MKHIYKWLAALLAVLLAMTLATTAFAEGTATTYTLTLQGNASGHTYYAYQVFSGTLSKDKETLSDVQWGSGVDTTKEYNWGTEGSPNNRKLLEVLLAYSYVGSDGNTVTPYEDCATAADVAKVLAGFADNSAQLDAFADIVEKYLKGTPKESSPTGTNNDYTISDLATGYYFVKETTVPEHDAYTKFILQLVGDATVQVKSDYPTLEKKIVEGTDYPETEEDESLHDANNAAIGDTITYQLTSKVPNMDGYNKYFFVVNDTMSPGLTYTENSVKVTIGGTPLEADAFTVTSTKNATDKTTTLEIVLNNFINYNTDDYVGEDIVITYSATLNENAEIGTTGNPNTVDLTYSNNPNYDYKGIPDEPEKPGNPDKPGPDEPVGETPKDTVITYVTEIPLLKVDGDDKKPLTGAKFRITGDALNTVVVTREVYEESTEGTYYKLKDGTYTEDAPAPGTEEEDKYDSTTIKYKLKTETEIKKTKEGVHAEDFVDDNGKLVFTGLKEGEYTITELEAPDGYNKLTDDITLKIAWTMPETVSTGEEECIWTYECKIGSEGWQTLGTTAGVLLTIENQAGAVLPSTGGVGTTLFYIIGSLLMLVAVVALVAKKIVSNNKKR